MNLKLPLKAKGNFFGMKESYTEIEDANGTIFRVSAPHDSTVNTQKTVQFIVSAVNNYEVMQAKLDKAVELLEACEPFIKQFAPNVLAPELESALKDLKGE